MSGGGERARLATWRERVVEGVPEARPAAIDFSRHQAEGLVFAADGTRIVVTRTGPRLPVVFLLLLFGMGAMVPVVALLLLAQNPHPTAIAWWSFAAACALWSGPFWGSIAWHLVARMRLRVGVDGVRISTATPFGETLGQIVSAAQIDAVLIGKPSIQYVGDESWLLIVTKRTTLKFGGGLSDAALEFLRDLVLAKLPVAGAHGRIAALRTRGAIGRGAAPLVIRPIAGSPVSE
jgi:hypothetical protein